MGLKDFFKSSQPLVRTAPVIAPALKPDLSQRQSGRAAEPAPSVPEVAAEPPTEASATEVTAAPLLIQFPDDEALAEQRRLKAEAERIEAAKKLDELSLSLLDRWNELTAESPEAALTSHTLGDEETSAATTPRTSASEAAGAVVNAIPDAILTFDAQGVIVSANAGAEAMFGDTAAALIGLPLVELLPGDAALWSAGVPAARAVQEWGGQRRDGTALVVEVSVGSVTVGATPHGAVVVRDITARRAAADALQAQMAETQAALEALRATQDKLVQSEKMASLGVLVAGIAHEINTPVGIAVTAASHLGERMALLAEAIREGTLKKSQLLDTIATSQQSVAMVLSNLERAAELIQSFKQVAVDQTSREQRTIDLDVYLHETLHSLHPRIKATPHRVELLCPPGITLHLAAGALSQVVSNLVLNALDHAFVDGRAGTLRLTVTQAGDQIALTMADDGVGIAPEVLPRIFDPFFTTRRGAGGSGLGLHIVYNLVTQTLGGSIAVESTPGHGTTFTVTLPLASAA